MSKIVYWCNHCEIPIIEQQICPICGESLKEISPNGICNPVFMQEKKLISLIFKQDFADANVWYLGNSYYLVNGQRKRLPYVDFFKNKDHLRYAEELRDNIINDDVIPNLDLYLSANERYINELIYEAEDYVVGLVQEIKDKQQDEYVPTVSFSGGKDSTVVSRLVRDALQDESVIHYFGDTTLEFPSTHEYVELGFRKENPFTPMIPSETDNDFFKLCNVFGPPSKFERWCCTIFKTSNLI